MKLPAKLTDSKIESLLASAADEFTAAIRRGENPSIEEFAQRFPDIATSIRSLLPAIAALDTGLSESGQRRPLALPRELASPFPTLGDFKILDELGRGGMGVVYRAKEISLDRIVALKVLPVSVLLDEQQLSRFKNEARAAATLDHPHIVPVYSVGVERGVHYYAMRLIDGQSLAEIVSALATAEPQEPYIVSHIAASLSKVDSERRQTEINDFEKPCTDQLGDEETSHVDTDNDGVRPHSTNNTTYIRNIAKLGLQAAQALDHAHSHGVLHRDIKPGNLLLDQESHLWITDFGVARLESDAGLTVTGDLLGTIRYMSPEQAIGDRVVDQRTDVYSLGVTLFEMLALRPAFVGNDRLDLLQRIAHDTPPRLRRLVPTVPQDLETIISKSMEKDVGDRYATARQLASDLECFLSDRPIAARPPSVTDRIAKWSRRHQAAVWAAVGVMAVALVALSISTLLVVRANRLHRQQVQIADANLTAALEVIDNGYAKEVERLKHEPGMTSKQQDFLTAMARFYEQLPTGEQANESLTARACDTRVRLGEILHVLGRDEESQKNFASAIEIGEQWLGVCSSDVRTPVSSRSQANRMLAKAHSGLGRVLLQQGRQDQSAHHHRQALVFIDAETSKHPSSLDSQRLATLRLEHALSVQSSSEREKQIRETVVTMADLQAKFTDEIEFSICFASASHHLGILLAETGRREEAEQQFRRAADVRQTLAARHPDIPGLRYQKAQVQNNLADMMTEQGRYTKAHEVRQEAIAEITNLVEDFPRRIAYQVELAQLKTESGRQQLELEHFGDSLDSLSTARQILESLVHSQATPRIQADLATVHSLIGTTTFQRGRRRGAKKHFEAAYELWSRLVDERPGNPDFQFGQATAQYQRARYLPLGQQTNEFQKAIAKTKVLLANDPSRVEFFELLVNLLGGYSALLREQGFPDQADQQTLSAIDVANTFADRCPEETPFLWFGSLAALNGDFAKAIRFHQAAAENFRVLMERYPDRPRHRVDLATGLKRLAIAQVSVGNHQAALESYTASVEIVSALAAEFPNVAAYHSKVERRYKQLAQLHLGLKDWELAAKAMEQQIQSLTILRTSFPDFPISSNKIVAAHVRLANVHLESARSFDAVSQQLNAAIDLCGEKQISLRVSLMAQLGILQSEHGQSAAGKTTLADAKALLSNSSLHPPQKAPSRWELAYANWKMGNQDEAKLEIKTLLDELPEDPAKLGANVSFVPYFIAHIGADDFDFQTKALRLAKIAVTQRPENSLAWHTLGMCQFRSEKYDDAERSLQKSSELKSAPFAFNQLILALNERARDNEDASLRHARLAAESLLLSDPVHLLRYRRVRDEL